MTGHQVNPFLNMVRSEAPRAGPGPKWLGWVDARGVRSPNGI